MFQFKSALLIFTMSLGSVAHGVSKWYYSTSVPAGIEVESVERELQSLGVRPVRGQDLIEGDRSRPHFHFFVDRTKLEGLFSLFKKWKVSPLRPERGKLESSAQDVRFSVWLGDPKFEADLQLFKASREVEKPRVKKSQVPFGELPQSLFSTEDSWSVLLSRTEKTDKGAWLDVQEILIPRPPKELVRPEIPYVRITLVPESEELISTAQEYAAKLRALRKSAAGFLNLQQITDWTLGVPAGLTVALKGDVLPSLSLETRVLSDIFLIDQDPVLLAYWKSLKDEPLTSIGPAQPSTAEVQAVPEAPASAEAEVPSLPVEPSPPREFAIEMGFMSPKEGLVEYQQYRGLFTKHKWRLRAEAYNVEPKLRSYVLQVTRGSVGRRFFDQDGFLGGNLELELGYIKTISIELEGDAWGPGIRMQWGKQAETHPDWLKFWGHAIGVELLLQTYLASVTSKVSNPSFATGSARLSYRLKPDIELVGSGYLERFVFERNQGLDRFDRTHGRFSLGLNILF